MIENEGLIELCIEGRTFHNSEGWIDITRDDLLQGVENFYNRPAEARELPIKYGTHEPGSDAAGWIKAMMPTERAGKLVVMALVDWTKRGRDAVKNKAQKFISPEFFPRWKNKETGKPQGFTFAGAALLNDPQLETMRPAFALSQGNKPFANYFANANMPSNQGSDMPKQKQTATEGAEPNNDQLPAGEQPPAGDTPPPVPSAKTFADTVKEILTVGPETTEAELLEMLKSKLQLACDHERMKMESEAAVKMSQTATATATEQAAKITTLSQTVDGQAAEIKTLSQKLADADNAIKLSQAEQWADKWILSETDRRLLPAQKDAFVKLYLSDKASAETIVASMPILSKLGEGTGIPGGTAGETNIDKRKDKAYKTALSQGKTPAEAAAIAAKVTE